MKRGPNMQDVADAAKVSLMTVSYALRQHPSIPAKTRERIQTIATELGYVRSPLVSALMTQIRGRKETKDQPIIAFLSSYPDRATMLGNSFRRACFEGATRRAESLGFTLELFLAPAASARASKRLSDVMAFRNVQAVICGISSLDSPPVALDWSAFASCVIGSSHPYPHHHHIESNYPGMVLLAIERLKKLGYSKIGFLSGSFENARVEDAVISALAGYNFSVPAREQIRFSVLTRKNWNAPHVSAWVKRHKLDALIIQSHTMYGFLSESAVKVPQDLAVATLERTEESKMAGIDQGPAEIGAAAVELVVNELYQNHRGIPETRHTLLLDGHWVDGPSAPPKS